MYDVRSKADEGFYLGCARCEKSGRKTTNKNRLSPEIWRCYEKQESHAIAKKPRDAVRFGLMFADIHYKFKRSQAPKARLQSYSSEKAEFNVKCSFKVIQCHAIWGQ